MNECQKLNVIISSEVDMFLGKLPEKARRKIIYNIKLVEGGYRDTEIFKKLQGCDIWEFRTQYAGMAYRLLAFFDPDTRSLIITTHGFIKKDQKTPIKEIERAKKIREIYLKNR